MKILILSDANSIHTQRWVTSLGKRGIQIGLWSFTKPEADLYADLENVVIFSPDKKSDRTNYFSKLKYIVSIVHLRNTIKAFQPDILHAHYASSYGLMGRLLRFHPYIVSVWGSDVYDFPKKNFVFKKLLKSNLSVADRILSTSEAMARETRKYTDDKIEITPFGVDTDLFRPCVPEEKGDQFIIGTVKALEEKYGIRYLIEAFAQFKQKFLSDKTLRLLIVGKGSQESELRKLTHRLGIQDICTFTGAVSYNLVPFYHNMLDISVFPSILDSESFGVSAVEASAVGKPVIVSKLGGLQEVVDDGVTGLHIKPKDVAELASALEYLYLNSTLRKRLGESGRKKVLRLYDWRTNVEQMVEIYNNVAEK